MFAKHATLLELLEGKRQFIIPIYQRTYSWTGKQCKQLWEDIVRTAQDSAIPAHFIGSVVYIKASLYDTPITSTPQMLVIDGQQRLTTLSLLLIALREALKAQGSSAEITAEEIEDYLANKHGKSDLKHKIVLTRSDKETLEALIDGTPLPVTPSPRVFENYHFFKGQIQTSSLSLDIIFLGIRKLMLVDISLDRSHDNPQLIFESLNSTGLDLSQADLIRNFVLMGQEPNKQTDLYNAYWFPMEQNFGHADNTWLFDRFMRDYLTIKMNRIPNMDDVYTEFKGFVHSKPDLSIQDIVADVHLYSQYFVALAFPKVDNKAIQTSIENINRLRVDVAYPFLMEVYRDYTTGQLSPADFLRVLHLVESYVFRRSICDIPTNSLNKTFASLYKTMNPVAYIESLEAAFLVKDSYRRFPNDDEFRAQLLIKDVYNFRQRDYLLGKLENAGHHKEIADVDDYTIEHIMPQTPNLSPAWLEDLGPNWKHVRDTYLHTLGNLTLTGYNSEYSDRQFLQKRDLTDKQGNHCGFAHSPLHLNQGIGILDHWNEDEILKRANLLADKAIKIWEAPTLDEALLKEYACLESSPSQYKLTPKARPDRGIGPDVYPMLGDDSKYVQATFHPNFFNEFSHPPTPIKDHFLWLPKPRPGVFDKWDPTNDDPHHTPSTEVYTVEGFNYFEQLCAKFDCVLVHTSTKARVHKIELNLNKPGWISFYAGGSRRNILLKSLINYCIMMKTSDAPPIPTIPEPQFGDWLDLVDIFRERISTLNSQICETYTHTYLQFLNKEDWIFSIVPKHKNLMLHINVDYSQVDDPLGIGCDAASKYTWAIGTNTTVAYIKTEAELDNVMHLIRQAYNHIVQ